MPGSMKIWNGSAWVDTAVRSTQQASGGSGAGDGLVLDGSNLDVNPGDGIEVENDKVKVKPHTGITVDSNGVSVANPFTDADETKLDGIEAGAEVNEQSDWNASSGDAAILNKPTIPPDRERGAWAASTAYAVGDIVTNGGNVYRFKTTTTGDSSFPAAKVDQLNGGGGATLTDDAVLDLAAETRVTGDRGKALATKSDNQDELALSPVFDEQTSESITGYDSGAQTLPGTSASFSDTDAAPMPDVDDDLIEAEDISGFGTVYRFKRAASSIRITMKGDPNQGVALRIRSNGTTKPAASDDAKNLGTQWASVGGTNLITVTTTQANVAAGTYVFFALSGGGTRTLSSREVQFDQGSYTKTEDVPGLVPGGTGGQYLRRNSGDTGIEWGGLPARTGAFTAAFQTKLDGIAAGAEVNVQSDWNASSGDARILNKPTIPSVPAKASNADVDAETDDSDYMTVLKVFRAIARKVKDASMTVKGIIEIATTSEADTGTDTGRAMTPALVKRRIEAQPRERGAWAASTAYKVGDVVTNGGNVYRFKTATTGDSSFPTTKVDQLNGGGGVTLTDDAVLDLADSSRGTGDRGKALGTSTTNQDELALLDLPAGLPSGVAGDILYHNGTAWVKLAKGTDGQVLELASGLPSWKAGAFTTYGPTLPASPENGDTFIWTTLGDSFDSGKTAPSGTSHPNGISVDASNGDLYLVDPTARKLYKSTDNGETWDSGKTTPFTDPHGVAVDSSNQNLYAVDLGTDRLYKSTNGGTTWDSGKTGPSGATQAVGVAVDSSNQDIYYLDLTTLKFYKSTDEGDNWDSGTAVAADAGNPRDIAVMPGGTRIWIVDQSDRAIYYSDDSGANWSTAFSSISSGQPNGLAVNSVNSDIWFSDRTTDRVYRNRGVVRPLLRVSGQWLG